MNFYLDTNIFIYLADKTSPYFKQSQELIRYCQKNKILISTSTETIQEVIHFAKNTKQLDVGLQIAKKIMSLIDFLFPVDQRTIEIYLKKASIYKSSKSRDLVHLASCLENSIDKFITYDSDFRLFKELKVAKPENII